MWLRRYAGALLVPIGLVVIYSVLFNLTADLFAIDADVRDKWYLRSLAVWSVAILLLVFIPKLQARSVVLDDRRLELENETRRTLAQLGGGVAIAIGLYLTALQLSELQRSNRRIEDLQQTSQFTDRFARAVEQLGSEHLEVRIGAIYSLEWIAQESLDTHWKSMEVLAHYVRERSPSRIREIESRQWWRHQVAIKRASLDVAAAITVISKRRPEHDPEDSSLNLRDTNLAGVDLRKARLENADLSRADLRGANLTGACICQADLGSADLMNANLRDADLRGASAILARLGPALDGTDLSGANLHQARIELREPWPRIRDVRLTQISYIDAPKEFFAWARRQGAIDTPAEEKRQDWIREQRRSARRDENRTCLFR